jgi:hypothetical protein
MRPSDEVLCKTLDALRESLSDVASRLEEITLRMRILSELVHNESEESLRPWVSGENLTRHLLGSPFYQNDDFDF